MTTPRAITTEYDPAPIPVRCFDWTAHFADDSEDIDENGRGTMLVGQGATEAEAIQELLDEWELREAEK